MKINSDDLQALGVSAEVADFVFNPDRNNRVLNQEGLEIGNTFTITGISESISNFVDRDSGELREWIDIQTEGDCSTMPISRLVGTPKRNKYFVNDRDETTFADNFAERNLLRLPQREGDAIKYILENCIGRTYEVVAIAERCGGYNRTFYLFAEA